jgi:hypothetical protein
VGTYTLFQETYHKPTFQYMHIAGPKSDFENRLLTQDRAMRAGLDDVGIGTLFGLYDYRFEVRRQGGVGRGGGEDGMGIGTLFGLCVCVFVCSSLGDFVGSSLGETVCVCRGCPC